MVEMARVWPILVEFGVGGLLCMAGIVAGVRSGYLDMKLPADRRLLGIIAGGYVGLLLLYCAFTFWLPFVGGGAPS